MNIAALSRLVIRRCLRRAIAHGPKFIGRAASRVPPSRYAHLLRSCLRGDEEITWRRVRMRVDPGEAWGYSLYFFPNDVDVEFDWLVEQCRTASLYVDAGAHVGIYPLAIARTYPAIRVIAFEPDPALAATIRKSIELDAALRDRVTVVQAAVGEKSGTVSFATASGFNRATGHVSTSQQDAGIEVALVSLGDYFSSQQQMPDVLKIDVEGAELNVLQGMRGLPTMPRAILIEVHSSALEPTRAVLFQSQLMDFLQSWNYQCRFLLHDVNWAETLPVTQPWPARVHVCATRTIGTQAS